MVIYSLCYLSVCDATNSFNQESYADEGPNAYYANFNCAGLDQEAIYDTVNTNYFYSNHVVQTSSFLGT